MSMQGPPRPPPETLLLGHKYVWGERDAGSDTGFRGVAVATVSFLVDTVVPTITRQRVSLVTLVGPAVGQCDLCHVILALAPIAPCMPL